MAEQYPKNLVPRFFEQTSHTYDKVASWATFGKDKTWKNEIVKRIGFSDSILDLACGTGILTRKLAHAFPKSKIVGLDITFSYLQLAEKNSAKFSNISFIHQDAEKLNLDEKFDCICSSYIPKYCNPETLVQKCISHITPNGQILLHDFVYPKNLLIRELWNLHFVLLNFVGKFLPDWKDAFKNLPNLIKTSNWVESYKKELEKNNFDVSIEYHTWNTSAILNAKRVD